MIPNAYVVFLLAAFQVGLANTINRGQWDPGAFAVLMLTLALVGWHFVRGPRPRPDAATGKAAVVGVLILLALMPTMAVLRANIVTFAVFPQTRLRAIEVGFLALIATYLPFVRGRREPRGVRTARFVAFAVLVALLGLEAIRLNPQPGIDVWKIQMRGAEVLLQEGKNPYVWAKARDTAPGVHAVVPYVYPPTPLYAGALGFLVGKDTRYAMVAAIVVAGIGIRLVARVRDRELPSVIEDAPALFFWLTPILPIIVELAWIDPIQVALIALGVAALGAERKILAAIAIGVAVSSKQTMFWLVPLVARAFGRDKKAWIAMAAAAALPPLPFVLWDAGALRNACFDFLAALPPRRDALGFTNAVWQWFHASFPPASAFVFALVTAAAAVLRRRGAGRREPDEELAHVTEGALATYFVFFFFNRWAFANYYFLLTGLAALAAGAALRQPSPQRMTPSAPSVGA